MERDNEDTVKRQSFVAMDSLRLSIEFIRRDAICELNAASTLVFLHEGLGSIAQWRDFPESLCLQTGLPGVVYERRGHGRSDPLRKSRTPSYLHEEALEVLPRLMSELHILRPILIGHSDGGSIALIYASAFPERAKAVITEAAHVFVEEVTIEGIRKAVAVYEKTNLREQLEKYHGEKTDAMFRAWSETWLSEEFRNWNIEEYLTGIKCPVLAIQGADDEYGSPAQVESIVKRVSGKAESLLIAGCGHIPHQQASKTVVEAIINFINRMKGVDNGK